MGCTVYIYTFLAHLVVKDGVVEGKDAVSQIDPMVGCAGVSAGDREALK